MRSGPISLIGLKALSIEYRKGAAGLFAGAERRGTRRCPGKRYSSRSRDLTCPRTHSGARFSWTRIRMMRTRAHLMMKVEQEGCLRERRCLDSTRG
jgi:hypothetical protein